jgi:Na+-translocating ferredoxin:NAD+ oxidoreductase subunit B
MSLQIYEKLREQLDQYAIGFPATKSGVEMKILKRLFEEDEASLYLDMTMMLEAPKAVAERTSRDENLTAEMLETMATKGLLFRLRKEDLVRYAAVPFVIGSFEFQLKRMDREFAELVEEYFKEGFLSLEANKNIPPLRTVPVHKSINVSWPVAPYVNAREIIKTKKKIALADCVCRTQQGFLDHACEKPMEVCMMFGAHADYYVENKMGRYVSQQEALEALDIAEKAGLVNQPANMVNPGGMCNCCGDCCGVLRALNKMPRPADMVFNNYFAAVDAELCTACETCIDRCQMAAIAINDDDVAAVDEDRCIGCGLCVTTCPTEAMSLKEKPESLQKSPPESGQALMMETAKLRGTSLIPLSMAEKK